MFKFTYQRYWHDNDDEIDRYVGNGIRKKHPEGIHAFLLEYPERSPVGFEVFVTSRGNCNEESQAPQDDDAYCDPVDDTELTAAEYPPIE